MQESWLVGYHSSMSSVPTPKLTPSEYLEIERAADFKSEFYHGEMFAMAGASRAHCLITNNLARLIGNKLASGLCETYSSDMRVKIDATGLYTYPDVVVVCDPPILEDQQGDTLVNPTILVEVLSKTTESYDRGMKSKHFRTIPSLRSHLLVSQSEPSIERYDLGEGGHWILTEISGLNATLSIPVIDCQIALSDIYTRIKFAEDAGNEPPRGAPPR